MKSIKDYLKRRWGIKKDHHIIVILLMFSITGTTTLFIHKKIDILLGVDGSTGFLPKLLIFIFLALPIFMLLLFVYGNILNQHKFVSRFLKMKYDLVTKGIRKIM